jgi:glycosyltransferase involved in cell wall biosynthesis
MSHLMVTEPDLSIVIPAYNEAARIGDTIRVWHAEARRLRISHEMIVCDDGSTDRTGAVVTAYLRDVSGLRLRHHQNRGHGPTILDGYRDARGEWVLQINGDDEVGPSPFESFWNERDRYDLLIGRRHGRQLAPGRRVLSLATRCAVGVLFGWTIADVNCPYRLMRRAKLAPLIADLPDDFFAPNVAISGLAIRRGLRIRERRVESRAEPRRRAPSWSTLAVARLSFSQLLAVSRRASPESRGEVRHRTTR